MKRSMILPFLFAVLLIFLIDQTHVIVGLSQQLIPDTGQIKCYNDSVEMICPQLGDGFYGQDASYIINSPSYTKLDTSGNDLPESAPEWVMVRDNVTGLIWEVKTDDGSIHDKDNTYSWNDSTCIDCVGNSENLIQALNDTSFGGYEDWRLPTIKELYSIVNFGVHSPAINTNYFKNTNLSYSPYMSSTTDAGYTNRVWGIQFYIGITTYLTKTGGNLVRAVRGIPTNLSDSFVNNDDGTITDSSTGLMWQQMTNGGNWNSALAYCENLELAGYDDWRLPNFKELQSIVNYNEYEPAIDVKYFPDTQSWWYSTSTTYSFGEGASLWCIKFEDGYADLYDKKLGYHVRSVRGGQNQIIGRLFITNPQQASVWHADTSMPIRWDTQGILGNVEISVSRDGGKQGSFDVVEPSTENDGTYLWTIQGPTSVNCVLKITPLLDNTLGTTQGLFTIIIDFDEDGVPDEEDNCPDTANPDQEDLDNDFVGDICDGCPNDTNKTEPLICGCGIPDTDSDNDGTPDCNDDCPDDPEKIEEGVCGCGIPDTDSDNDGITDCNDTCNYDGICNTPEDCITCSDDCIGKDTGKPSKRYCCGDGVCEGEEDNFNCAIDCGSPPACGDGNCETPENSCNCPDDCNLPPSYEISCIDGIDNDCDSYIDCNDLEDCSGDLVCNCKAKGELCDTDDECCSNDCRGKKCK